MQYFGFDKTLGQMRTFGFGVIAFLPTELFATGEQGVWYDPSDLSTLFQDAAMTIPVTANGDPVGAMMDLSGNGNHATQSVSASRPTYQTDGILHRLQFDGVDDNIVTAMFSGVLGQPFNILIATNQKTQPANFRFQFDSSVPNRVSLLTNREGLTEVSAGVVLTESLIVLDETSVYTMLFDNTTSSIQRNNEPLLTGNLGASGLGNLILGRIASTPNFHAKMDFYGMVISKGTDKPKIKEYLAQKSGVTL